MRTYCLACRKHIKNVGSWNTTMTNKEIKNKSKCGVCLSDKSRFMKQKPVTTIKKMVTAKKVVSNTIKQTCCHIV